MYTLSERFRCLAAALPVAFLALALATGCQSEQPIFAKSGSPLAWPEPPQTPRIRYVGQLRAASDLKPRRSLLESVGEALVGGPAAQPLYGPRAVLHTTEGDRLWVADAGGRCLHLFDLAQRRYQRVTQVGTTRLMSPVGLCAGPAGSLYVCDSESGLLHRLSDADGKSLESVILPDSISRPVALRYDPSHDEIFVADVQGHDIKVLARNGALRRTLGHRGTGPGEFNLPCDLALVGEKLWVADTGNQRVQCLALDGTPVSTLGSPGDAPGNLALPKGLALDSAGHVYVVDARFENFQIFDREGRLLLTVGAEGAGPGEFSLPSGIFIDSKDRIWLCDTYNRRIQVFDYLAGPEEPQP
ncbi:MAG: 6-bladed beta-propeller [Planctomycetes bacterium]|nr:6-bladed beta-propeller [Planctomycetota bacterium]